MPGSKLIVREVSKIYSQDRGQVVLALEQTSLTVSAGEFVSLIGPSGCGKSTLLDLVAGLATPDSGEIMLDGQSIVGQRGKVSYMPQSDVLFPWRTVLDNVLLPLQLRGVPIAEARAEALALLPTFGLEKFAHSYPYMLSGGMKQRAAFLRTYLCRKDLMLLDEPFGKLDALTRRQMQGWLLEMWQRFNQAVLFVTHDVDEAILLSDRIFLMSPSPGRILLEMKITLPRPRQPRMVTERAFTEIKQELLHWLEKSI